MYCKILHDRQPRVIYMLTKYVPLTCYERRHKHATLTPRRWHAATRCLQRARGGVGQFAGSAKHLQLHLLWCAARQPFSPLGRLSCPWRAAGPASPCRPSCRLHAWWLRSAQFVSQPKFAVAEAAVQSHGSVIRSWLESTCKKTS